LPVNVVSEPGDGDGVGDEKKAPERERESLLRMAVGGEEEQLAYQTQ
jgi:hypothetical protein